MGDDETDSGGVATFFDLEAEEVADEDLKVEEDMIDPSFDVE